MTDVVVVGEAVVDFLPDRRGQPVRAVKTWHPCLGGAPANVSVGLARLGADAALAAVVGEDEFGHFLKDGLAREGVDVRCVRHTAAGKTSLGFVSLTRQGERSFTFYRKAAAETFFDERDGKAAARLLRRSRALHVGTNALLFPHARAAVRGLLAGATKAGLITSTDPNLRLHLWDDHRLLRRLLDELVSRCAVVKLSEEETRFVTGHADPGRALGWLRRRGVSLAVVTQGARGALFSFGDVVARVPAPRVKVVDTTGAGDGFAAGLLYGLTRQFATRAQLDAADPQVILGHVRFGCLVGARVVTKLGAVAGLPRLSDLAGPVRRTS